MNFILFAVIIVGIVLFISGFVQNNDNNIKRGFLTAIVPMLLLSCYYVSVTPSVYVTYNDNLEHSVTTFQYDDEENKESRTIHKVECIVRVRSDYPLMIESQSSYNTLTFTFAYGCGEITELDEKRIIEAKKELKYL